MIVALILASLTSLSAQPALLPEGAQEDLLRRMITLVDPQAALTQFGERRSHETSIGPAHGGHVKCGTLLISEVAANWGRLSKATQAGLSRFFQRQNRQESLVSRNGRFLIHYDITGSSSVPPFDDDSSGIPDYVEFVADTFEDVWDLEVTQLGYLEPPPDDDGRYDIYIKNLGNSGVYGLAWPDPGGTTTASYLEIDNDFTENIYFTQGRKAVQVTAAHEFFHAIQFAYYAPFDVAWWQELTATWMEDFAYDEVNDYYAYVEFFQQDPEESLDKFSFGNLRPFGASIFGHYIADVYGPETIRATWESLGTRTPATYDILDIDLALPGGIAGAYPRFAVWNYFTGSRKRDYYDEGDVFREVSLRAVQPIVGQTIKDFKRVDHFGATYVQILASGISGGLRIVLSLDEDATWDVVVLLVTQTGLDILRPPDATIEIPSAGSYEEVVVIPIVVSSSGTNFTVDYSVTASSTIQSWSHLVADFDNDGEVSFNDFIGFADSFGKSGSEGHDERHDLNADGRIDFTDFLSFSRRFGDTR
ncbi:MAG: hypothetical protein CME26_12445 [Gemmatimonadetes bacterium]|mgnify:CR=1 FL=1|nr:hypothetical protein [Gemmatimonadota bacterium]|tara:strand:+ start:2158 stop:3759 length:1602 start_codon:yes stop_codon:yes gene_type:complete